MTMKEKLEFVEKVLKAKPGTLTEDTPLNTLPMWDSLAMLNLQIEMTALKPDVQFDDLYMCDTVGDICKMI